MIQICLLLIQLVSVNVTTYKPELGNVFTTYYSPFEDSCLVRNFFFQPCKVSL